MAILVQKYGGSSVADIDKLKKVAAMVVAAKDRGYDMVVVVSAMGKSTDELIGRAKAINPAPNARELDMLVSVGERISMALLSMAIHALGHNAISFTGSQSGIITNDNAGAARIIEVRPYRLQDELTKGNIVIVAGYQGVSYRREVTTLGRGGSDTTAVALAAALGAEACEIYSDVEGVYSSDPRVVLDARLLERVSYDEMQEMARLGAKVLNAEAVEFARRAGIALYARATGGSKTGTEITRIDGFPDHLLEEERACFVTGIAGRKDVILVEYTCPPSGDDRSREFLAALDRCELLFSSTRSGRDAALALVSTENMPDIDTFIGSLRREFSDLIGVRTELGLVSAIGSGVGNRTQAQGRLLDALAAAELQPKFSFTSRTSASAVVHRDDVEEAMRIAHREFLGG